MSGNIFVTSDTHFGHKNIINYTRNQFSSIEEHNETIVANINSVVSARDTLVLLGDMAFGKHNLKYVKMLNGYKRVVLANHDIYAPQLYLEAGIDRLYGAWEKAGLIFTHIPVHPCQFERYKGNVHGHMHDVLVTCRDDARLGPKGLVPIMPDNRYFNACPEQHDMMPVHLDTIKEYFKL